MTDRLEGFVVHAGSRELLRRVGPGGEELLNPDERTRAARLRNAGARYDFRAAHLLVRACAARVLDRPLSAVRLRQRCPSCGGPHGRIQLRDSDWQVSLAHSGGQVAAGIAPGPIGVDLEVRAEHARVLRSTLTERERRLLNSAADPGWAFLRLWVRKEALVKIGHATLDGVAGLDVSTPPLPPSDHPAVSARLAGYELVEWSGPRAVGAAVSSTPLIILGLADLPLPAVARS